MAEIVADVGATRVVVGLPLSLDRSEGPRRAPRSRERRELEAVVGVPVETYDERLTTVTAERVLAEQHVTGRERRRVVDKVAATILLQSWLDRRADQP